VHHCRVPCPYQPGIQQAAILQNFYTITEKKD
jgi:hypothetical protein